MTTIEPQCAAKQLRKDQLKLLSLSKNLLLLAEQERFSELQIQQTQWQALLEEMLAKYGAELEPIRLILKEDAEQLNTLLQNKQSSLAQELSKDLKANKSVRKYVNF